MGRGVSPVVETVETVRGAGFGNCDSHGRNRGLNGAAGNESSTVGWVVVFLIRRTRE